MKHSHLNRLLHGPYHPPALKRGQRATCYYRDADVVITSWSNARLSWPRCKIPGQRGRSGLLIDEELLRAIRTESAIAIQYWCGVSNSTVTLWRQTFGVEKFNEGSRRLRNDLNAKHAAALRGKKLSRKQVQQRRRAAAARGLTWPDNRTHRWKGKAWTDDKIALLGTMPDEEVAAQIGHSVGAVSRRRIDLGIPKFDNRSRAWTKAELALLGTMRDEDVAAIIDRTVKAVLNKRTMLGIPCFQGQHRRSATSKRILA